MAELLFAFFLAEIYQIAPSVIGVLMFVFLAWDALTDPLLGVLIGRKRISTAGLLKMQFVGAVLCSLTFCAAFFRPPLSGEGLIVYALFAGILFRTTYTIYDVPQNTLLGRLPDDARGRLALSSARVAVGALATITIGLATTSILSGDSVAAQAQGYTYTAIGFSCIALASSASLFYFAKDMPEAQETAQSEKKAPYRFLLRPDLLILFISIFGLRAGWSVFKKLVPFFAFYVLEFPAMAGMLLITMAAAQLLSQPLLVLLDRTVSRVHLYQVVGILVLISCIIFFLFSDTSQVSAIILLGAMAAMFSTVNMLAWTRLADRTAAPSNRDVSDILVFGAFSFSSKFGLGVGGLLLGVALSTSGYAPGEVLTPQGKERMIFWMAFAPLVVTSLAGGLLIGESRRRTQSSETGRGHN